MERWLVPLNWTIGTMLLVVAVLYPALNDKFFAGSKMEVAKLHVAKIEQLETEYYRTNERYMLFPSGEMPGPVRDKLGLDSAYDHGFVYDVYLEDGQLVVRAQVVAEKILSGEMPPMTYVLRKNISNGQLTQAWEPLSGKKPGLF